MASENLLQDARVYNVSGLNEKSVSLYAKDLTSIPKFVFSMPNLQSLILTDNDLTKIPDDIGNLTKLVSLYIYFNKLSTLPAAIGKLAKLEYLYIGNNKLTTLPDAIGNLKKLESMVLDANLLTSLPESIGNLKKLETMALDDNRLTTLPESIGKLVNLEVLYLDNNRLTTLPESIGDLKNLQELSLTGNPIMSIPSSMKNLPSTVKITYDKPYTRDGFMRRFSKKAVRVTNATNIMNNSFMNTRLSNVPPNKRAFINTNTNVKNGVLRRVYNVNGLRRYMEGKPSGRLHGGAFTHNNIRLLKNVTHTVNKSAYLRNIKSRFANTSLNNFQGTVRAVKDNLPGNVSKTDVNQIVNGMKNAVRQRISNRLRTTPAKNRAHLINTYRSMGLL